MVGLTYMINSLESEIKHELSSVRWWLWWGHLL